MSIPSIQRLQITHQGSSTVFNPSEASGGLLLLSSSKGTLRAANQNVICSLSRESGYTAPHALVRDYCTRPPKLIRKLTSLREAKMELLFNPLCLSRK